MKETLLESAVGTFRRHGVRGSSVGQIASDASVPVGSVYNHFAGKEGLAIEVLRRYAAGTDTSMLERDGSAIERLREHLEHQIARTTSTGTGYGCVLANFAGELTDDEYPLLRHEVQAVLEQWSAALAEVIRQGQESGEIRSSHSPEALGTWLVTSLEGATTHAKAVGSREPVDAFVAITFDTVLAPASR
jgi:TetR/AcrR family transcriptional repressor of nem operon